MTRAWPYLLLLAVAFAIGAAYQHAPRHEPQQFQSCRNGAVCLYSWAASVSIEPVPAAAPYRETPRP